MLLKDDVFRRLCLARELLCDAREPAPSVREIAGRLGLSPFHFIRQFAAVFGGTPHQHRIRSRLARARGLLALRDLSVTDVCLEVGFSSLGSFSALFTRELGASPTAYRRRVRAQVQVPASLPDLVQPDCLQLMARLPEDAFRNFREASGPGGVVPKTFHPNL